ncbi:MULTISPECIES: PilW family protein [Pseudoalteromonas]|uniref:Prepilin-type N-terminal cleavage/methylation domain-containing protein n=1 Tax=Pseudoalteromonas fuliginea TaxID=1872678 RepID=A0A833AGS6_9GAMM|nr:MULTISPECIES: PilW family protein [Pseudoalteromonas]ALQ07577.1 pilus assembly protein PilW [Pseudoalteromonas sp. Bsw20308]ATG78191.1 pilus assembly protein PilW [Pseudoalteromonas sp. 1_2015MBL_MicDiv]KAA1151606.1 prepilin-type N-terminal cleavage/methylation domain-containing protein [Pseudoalteromonas fuliginea]KAA1156426.1 prepilin-type N-terminal cleavage/methylation domain-containing protein [Pseudoalteromonas fuliginea]KAA1166073.1 prepilin-type N-terminal cleavage/methylation domai
MKQKGFTLIEVMISLFIGGLVLGGVMFTYIGMKVTTRDTMTIGELQESGRLAINIMQRDIEQIGFWGTFYDDSFSSANTTTLATPNAANDCLEGLNNGSFPDLSSTTNFRTIYAKTAGAVKELNCVTNPIGGTDILQLKFLQGDPITVKAGSNETQNKENYFIAEQERAQFVRNIVDPATLNVNATVWPYSHHVYYISNQTYTVNNNKLTVPALMRKRLVDDAMKTETIMEGVENMRFVFGLDTTNDSRIDMYKSIDNMAPADWENRKGILTVQVFLLIRALQPDADLSIKNQTYTLGEDADNRELQFTDNFRRTVFTTTIRLNNVGENLWRI